MNEVPLFIYPESIFNQLLSADWCDDNNREILALDFRQEALQESVSTGTAQQYWSRSWNGNGSRSGSGSWGGSRSRSGSRSGSRSRSRSRSWNGSRSWSGSRTTN